MLDFSKFIVLALITQCLVQTGLAQHSSSQQVSTAQTRSLITPQNSLPMPASGEVPRDAYGRPQTYLHLDAKLPEFETAFSDGTGFNSDELVGRWTVIRIWGPWCHDSLNDQPFAKQVGRALKNRQDVAFLSLMTPRNASYAPAMFGEFGTLETYYAQTGDTTNHLVDADARVREQLAIAWTPSYIVVNPHLRVTGFRTELSADGDQAVETFIRELDAMINAGRG